MEDGHNVPPASHDRSQSLLDLFKDPTSANHFQQPSLHWIGAMNGFSPTHFDIRAEDNTPPTRIPSWFELRDPPGSRSSSKSLFSGTTRRPISPPPLKRSPSGTAHGSGTLSDLSGNAKLVDASSTSVDAEVSRTTDAEARHVGIDESMVWTVSRPVIDTPSPQRSLSEQQPLAVVNSTPKAQMFGSSGWSVAKIAEELRRFRQEVKDGHARLTTYMIESTKASEWRVQSGKDLFANIKIQPNTEKQGMRAKFKQHSKKRDHREEYYETMDIKTTKDRVPRYRFHHKEIKKNVLTPNTSLTFYPHLRDLKSNEERRYSLWLRELEDYDLQSGFKPMNREEKAVRTSQSERARTLSLYLEEWLDRLAIPGCNKSTLIQCMATQEPDDAITPQQKTDILKSQQPGDDLIPGVNKAAEMFTDAFRVVFEDGQPPSKQILLRDVLLLDESVDNIMDSKPTAKDGANAQNSNEDDLAETNLATYCILGCLICFSHSCEHGEYDNTNCKHTFSISSSRYRLRDVLGHRRRPPAKPPLVNGHGDHNPPCRRNCYRQMSGAEPDTVSRAFSEDEIIVLRSIFTTADHSKVKKDALCLAADFLNRDCWEVHREFERLQLTLPPPGPSVKPPPRGLSWYDRFKKTLTGDWQDHTVTHEHQRREVLEPCFHEGPCAPKICSCVDAGVLCERFCGCTLESCAYKFNGCNCHAQGKICQRRHQDKTSSCICVSLNRECDPTLCGPCGAFARADPKNADDSALHSTGCQNCELQRGASIALLLGQSQLEGVGYGLFTAEAIAQDEFVVEYVGELIVHDEGVRREARRGDVFNEQSTISYLFTLLDSEGIWVDAAQYGNLSRYINHAGESEKRGCNITPRILYVNGEFRIKFTALRDIKAGEELFFNYGDEFPNLTKKLLDNKAGEAAGTPKRKNKQQTRVPREERVPRKAPKVDAKKPGRPRVARAETPSEAPSEDERDEEWAGRAIPARLSRKRKRQSDDTEEEDYQPTGTDVASNKASDSGRDSAKLSPRLRKRLKAQSKLRQSGGPAQQRGQPKTRGKRGGARPGSGRPRKYPRPVPPSTPAAAQPAAEGAAAQPTPPGVDKPLAPENTPKQPEQPEPSQNSREALEIEDSFEGHTSLLDDEDEDQDEDEDEDEDEDQDVIVRKRHDRASRNRRLPKKYREGGESGEA